MNKWTHFNNTTGQNIGKLQNTKLANFLRKKEAAMRALRKRDEAMYNVLHLGALCKANDINEDDLKSLFESKGSVSNDNK